MLDVTFHAKAFKDYINWQAEDRKTLKKINALIEDIQRNGFMKGIGKPEPLKHEKGYSRHIDDANRRLGCRRYSHIKPSSQGSGRKR